MPEHEPPDPPSGLKAPPGSPRRVTGELLTEEPGPPALDGDAAHDAELARLQALADLLDTSIRVPLIGYRIGLDPLIGLIPGVGDVIGFGLSGYLIHRAHRLGVPLRTRVRMLGNAGLEAVLGFVPLVGDLFDFGWRANSMNVRLIVRHLEREQRRRTT